MVASISRRAFVGLSALTAGSLLLPSVSPNQAYASTPIHSLVQTTALNAEYVGVYLYTGELKYFRVNNSINESISSSDISLNSFDSFGYLPASNEEPPASSLSIIGPDSRWEVSTPGAYPFRAIGRIRAVYSNKVTTGTATFISKTGAITAAHCVYDRSGNRFPSSMTMSPGQHGTSVPYGPYSVTSVYLPYEYYATGNVNYDYAILGFSSTYGNTVGYYGLQYGRDVTEDPLRVVGYPSDKNSEMWGCSGRAVAYPSDPAMIEYPMDTLPGMSGSAVATFETGARPNRILGIHTLGVPGYDDVTEQAPLIYNNSGVLVNQRIFLFANSFRVNGE